MREDPDRRFVSAAAMRSALRGIGARRFAVRKRRWLLGLIGARRFAVRKRRWLLGLALAGAVVVGWRMRASHDEVLFAGLW